MYINAQSAKSVGSENIQGKRYNKQNQYSGSDGLGPMRVRKKKNKMVL